MGEANLSGTPPVSIRLRHSPRARRLSLRVSALDGRVTLTLPRGVAEREALAFAEEKADWIRKALAGRVEPVRVEPGVRLCIAGRELTLEAAEVRTVRAEGRHLLVPAGRAGRAAEAWIKAQARERLAEVCDTHAGRIGATVARIALSDPRSRWGSCSAAGRLMFSWRLLLAPQTVLDYVAAHEVAHLHEMNHGPRFWSLVETLVPDWRGERDWLRTHGAHLHRYRFDD